MLNSFLKQIKIKITLKIINQKLIILFNNHKFNNLILLIIIITITRFKLEKIDYTLDQIIIC